MILRKKTLAMPLMVIAMSLSKTAYADDWGCQVLLCLSDPRGPTTEAECKPPIHKLWRHLAKGKAFPSCALSGNADTGEGSYAKQVYEPYDPCPDGLVPAGGYVKTATTGYMWSGSGRINQNTWEQNTREIGFKPKAKESRACVGNLIDRVRIKPDFYSEPISVAVYDQIVWQTEQNPRAIDIYIDSTFHNRVRW